RALRGDSRPATRGRGGPRPRWRRRSSVVESRAGAPAEDSRRSQRREDVMLRRFMRVGSLEIAPGALLAPMEAVTDLPFRTVCEELGAVLTFTEFLSAEALTRGARKA